MDTRLIVRINPSMMTHQDEIILTYFLDHYFKLKIILFHSEHYDKVSKQMVDAVHAFPVYDKYNKQATQILEMNKQWFSHLVLDHSLLLRPCSHFPDEQHVDVYAKGANGSGAYGVGRRIIGVLRKNKSGIFTLINKENRIAKFMSRNVTRDTIDDFKRNVNREHLLTSRVFHLSPKPLVRVSGRNKNTFIMNMKLLKGEVADLFISRDMAALSTDPDFTKAQTRLELGLESALEIWKLQRYYHVLHRDIKSQNFIIDHLHQDKPARIKLFDLGLSCDITNRDKRRVGTPLYAAPEFHDFKQLTERSDIYSFGEYLAELFRSDPNPSKSYPQLVALSHHRYFKESEMFHDITDNDISAQHKDRIRTLINRALLYDPLLRCNIDEIIDVFDDILLERKLEELKTKPIAILTNVRNANRAARELRYRLYEIYDESENNTLAGISMLANLDTLKKSFNELFQFVADCPLALNEFLEKSAEVILRKMVNQPGLSRALVSDTFMQLIATHEREYNEVKLLSQRVADFLNRTKNNEFVKASISQAMQDDLTRIGKRLVLILRNCQQPVSLDVLDEMNGKLGKYLQFTKQVAEYERRLHILELASGVASAQNKVTTTSNNMRFFNVLDVSPADAPPLAFVQHVPERGPVIS